MNELTWRSLRGPILLLVLSVVPMLGGVVRFMSLTEPSTVESARFVTSPAPVVLHIVSSVLFCLLGAFQFSSAVRLRWPGWHRRAGTLLTLCGLLSGLTGMWMTTRYNIPSSLQGPVLYGVRLTVGAAMVGAIIAAWSSIARRDVPRHEAWMIRAYALGHGAGMQVLVLAPLAVIFGQVEGLARDLLMTLAWAINIGVAEWLIGRRRHAPRDRLSQLTLATRPS